VIHPVIISAAAAKRELPVRLTPVSATLPAFNFLSRPNGCG
jgi:hypothetical protein